MQTSSSIGSRRLSLVVPRGRAIALSDELVLFVALTIAYLVAAVYVTLIGHSIVNDTWAHVANSYYVLFSRDPHLAAIGFVWLPLPSLIYLPIIVFKDLWPPLVQEAFAANLVSVVFMAGAAFQLFRWFRELGLSRFVTWVLVLLFAFHPMIFYYAANGMTEAMFLFFVVLTGRYLTRWLVDPTPSTLGVVAAGLAFAYLVRYETIAMAIAVIGLIGVVAVVRNRGGVRARRDWMLSEAIVVSLPFVAVLVGWAAASWIITGHPFEQFSSVYGIEGQVNQITGFLAEMTGRGTNRVFDYASYEVFGTIPLLAIPIVAMLLVPIARRDVRPLAVLATLGAILAVSLFVFLTGRSNGFLRYFIAVVPLAVAASACVLAAAGHRAAGLRASVGWSPSGDWLPPRLQRIGLQAVVIGALALSLPIGWTTMANWQTGREEAEQLALLAPTSVSSSATVDKYVSANALADYLDELRLPPGSVLLDTFAMGPVVLSSERPQQFVITSDRDFQAILAAPDQFDVRYLAVPRNEGLTSIDALNSMYPELWNDGGGMATFVREFGKPDGVDVIRLYRLDR